MKTSWYIILLLVILSACSGEQKYYAIIETEAGTMKAELYNSTPIHRDNFIKLCNENFYDDLLFHRVIQGFMIQGGDPDSKDSPAGARLGTGGPGYTIPAEIGAPHFKGCLAAARTGGPQNPAKRSSGSQFYIVQGTPQPLETLDRIASSKRFAYNDTQKEKYASIGGTPALDLDYTVFGELVDGFDVIDKIAAVSTDSNDRPLEDVKMKISIVKQ